MIRHFFRILIISIIITILCVIGIIFYVPQLIPQDDLKQQISITIKQSTGYDVEIMQDVTFSIAPEFELSFQNANLSKFEHNIEQHSVINNFVLKIDFWSFVLGDLESEIELTLDGKSYKGQVYFDNLAFINDGSATNLSIIMIDPINYHISANFTANSNSINVQDIKIKSDKTRGEGSFSSQKIVGNNAPLSQIKSELKFSQLDIGEIQYLLLPMMLEDSAQQSEVGSVAPAKDAELWSSVEDIGNNLRDIDLDIDIKIDRLIYKQSNISNLHLVAQAQDDIWNIKLNKFNIYGGQVSGDFVFKNLETPYFLANMNVKDLHLGDILKDQNIPYDASGLINLDVASLQASGKSQKSLVAALAGDVNIGLKNGYIKNIDFVAIGNKALKDIAGLLLNSHQDAQINSISARFDIENGVINNDDLEVDIALSPISGKGSLNLNNYWVKYRLTPSVVGVAKVGIKVPVLIKGDVRNPKIKLDQTAAIVKNIDQLGLLENKQVEKVKNKINKLIGKDLGNQLLKGLLGK